MSYFWTIKIPYFQPIKDETNLNFIKLGSNIKDNILCHYAKTWHLWLLQIWLMTIYSHTVIYAMFLCLVVFL
jgi:hypothetical protein